MSGEAKGTERPALLLANSPPTIDAPHEGNRRSSASIFLNGRSVKIRKRFGQEGCKLHGDSPRSRRSLLRPKSSKDVPSSIFDLIPDIADARPVDGATLKVGQNMWRIGLPMKDL